MGHFNPVNGYGYFIIYDHPSGNHAMVEKTFYFRPLIPLSLALAAGIAVGEHLPGYIFSAVTIVILGIARLMFLVLKTRAAVFGPLFLMAAAGYLSIQPWMAPDLPTDHIIHYANTHRLKISGSVITRPVSSNGRIKFHLNADRIEDGNRVIDVQGKIRVTVMGRATILKGDRIRFSAKIRSIRNFKNPGGFDYERHMAFQRVFVSAYIAADGIRFSGKKRPSPWVFYVDRTRAAISAFIDDKLSSGPDDMAKKAVLKALVVGDKSLINKPLREAFNRAGVSHLLAISGLHVGIVAAFSFALLSWIFSYIKPLLWYGWTRRCAAVISLLPVVFYGLLAGMPPSTQRAVIMVSVFLMAFFFQKDHDPMNTLAVAAVLILVIHPPSLFSISFQLSFSAVFAILYGLSLVPERDREKDTRFMKWSDRIKVFCMVSVSAFFGTLPIVLFYFNQVPALGIIANLAIVPMLGFGAVPAGLLSALILPFSPVVAGWFLAVSAVLIKTGLLMVYSISNLSFSAVKTITPSGFEICLFYLSCFVLLKLLKNRVWIYAMAALVILWSADGIYWLNQRYWHRDLKVTAIDVGQGGAALIEVPGGFTALYDGGGFYDNTVFDVGEKIIAPFLWKKKIGVVDLIVLSHPNSDHLNGLIYIARHFNVKSFWSNNEPVKTKGYLELMDILRERGVAVADFKQMKRRKQVGKAVFTVLYPPKDFLHGKTGSRGKAINNNSLVMKVAFGSTAFLFTGDLMAKGEMELIKTKGALLESTIMFIPHHGSKTSSTKAFLKKIRPEVAVVSAGFMNRFGFPKPSVIKRYETAHIRVFSTCSQGAICFSSNGASVNVEPFIRDMEK